MTLSLLLAALSLLLAAAPKAKPFWWRCKICGVKRDAGTRVSSYTNAYTHIATHHPKLAPGATHFDRGEHTDAAEAAASPPGAERKWQRRLTLPARFAPAVEVACELDPRACRWSGFGSSNDNALALLLTHLDERHPGWETAGHGQRAPAGERRGKRTRSAGA